MTEIIRFTKPVNIKEVLKYNSGIKPSVSKKDKGSVKCVCNFCVGKLIYTPEKREVVGWLLLKCSVCGSNINWSCVEKYL